MRKALLGLLVLFITATAFFREDLRNIWLLSKYAGIFEASTIDHNFRNLHQQYPSLTIPKSGATYTIPTKLQDNIFPTSFMYEGETLPAKEELEERHFTSLVVLKDGKIISEEYFRGHKKEDQAILFSCTKSIVSSWIQQSTTPDKPHLIPMKNNPHSEFPEGYKNQWWIPLDRDGGDYSAIGIFGQSLYINPARNIVIAATGAYPAYNEDIEHADSRRLKLFQAIAQFIN